MAYPFGYGLSYTTFEFGKPSVKAKGNNIEVSVTIKNTGKVAGKEVAEVYVTAPKGAYEKPAKELKTFGKTKLLNPGESQTLKMILEKRDLASFDEANSQWKVDAGNYLFKVGSDVENIKGTATLKVAEYTEKTSNACAPKVQFELSQKELVFLIVIASLKRRLAKYQQNGAQNAPKSTYNNPKVIFFRTFGLL